MQPIKVCFKNGIVKFHLAAFPCLSTTLSTGNCENIKITICWTFQQLLIKKQDYCSFCSGRAPGHLDLHIELCPEILKSLFISRHRPTLIIHCCLDLGRHWPFNLNNFNLIRMISPKKCWFLVAILSPLYWKQLPQARVSGAALSRVALCFTFILFC